MQRKRRRFMSKQQALILQCSHGEASVEVDHCWTCAPWWHKYPVCPSHKKKLSEAGYCKDCKKFYDISELKSKTKMVKIVECENCSHFEQVYVSKFEECDYEGEMGSDEFIRKGLIEGKVSSHKVKACEYCEGDQQ